MGNPLIIKKKLKTLFTHELGAFDYRNGWMKLPVCPICGSDMKMGINLAQDRVHCFRCEYQGKLVPFAMHIKKMSYHELINHLLTVQEGNYVERPVEIIERKPVVLPDGYRRISRNDTTIAGKRAYKYATQARGITYAQARRLKLGYVKDINSSYYNHLIIPYYFQNRVVYFQARRIGPGIKFNNPKLEDYGIGKNSLIYNRDVLSRFKEVSIVESAINVITIAPQAVAILSKSISQYQLDVINKANVEIYNIVLDPDAITQAIALGLKLCHKHKIRIVILPKDEDVNSIGREATEDLIARSKIQSWSDLILLKQRYAKRT